MHTGRLGLSILDGKNAQNQHAQLATAPGPSLTPQPGRGPLIVSQIQFAQDYSLQFLLIMLLMLTPDRLPEPHNKLWMQGQGQS